MELRAFLLGNISLGKNQLIELVSQRDLRDHVVQLHCRQFHRGQTEEQITLLAVVSVLQEHGKQGLDSTCQGIVGSSTFRRQPRALLTPSHSISL